MKLDTSMKLLARAENIQLFVVSIIAGGVELTGFSVTASGDSIITTAILETNQRENAEALLVEMERVISKEGVVSLVEKDGRLYLNYVRKA